MEITKVVKNFIRRGWTNTFANLVYVCMYVCVCVCIYIYIYSGKWAKQNYKCNTFVFDAI